MYCEELDDILGLTIVGGQYKEFCQKLWDKKVELRNKEKELRKPIKELEDFARKIREL